MAAVPVDEVVASAVELQLRPVLQVEHRRKSMAPSSLSD